MEGKDGEVGMAYKRGDPLIDRKPLFLAASKALTWFIELLGWPLMKALYGYSAKGRKNLAAAGGKPVILVSNHAVPLDPLFHGLAILPRFTYYTLLEETVLTPILGGPVRRLGGIPIPTDPDRLDDIEAAVRTALNGRRRIHFYPEGECFLYNQEIQRFKAGAFYYAIRFGVPIIPIITVLTRRGARGHTRGRGRELGREQDLGSGQGLGRVRAEIHILPALVPPAASGRQAADLHAAILLSRPVRALMQARIDAAGGDRSLYRGPMPRIKGVNDRER